MAIYNSGYGLPTGELAAALSEETYAEQQFSLAEVNGDYPTDGLQSVLQNLLPTLLNPNPLVQNMVTLALGQLEASQYYETGNADGIAIGAEFAKLTFEAAESDTLTSGGSLATEYEKTNLVGKSDPYEFWVTPNGTPNGTTPSTYNQSGDIFYDKNDGGTVIDDILGGLDTYVEPIVDVAAAVTGNFELIVAASALTAVQAG